MLWNFNFGQSVFVTVMIIFSLIVFGITRWRIKNMMCRLESRENAAVLARYRRITQWAFWNQFFYLMVNLFGLYTQGYYNHLAVAQSILTNASFSCCALVFMVIAYRNNLDLTLQTQVLNHGKVALLGID